MRIRAPRSAAKKYASCAEHRQAEPLHDEAHDLIRAWLRQGTLDEVAAGRLLRLLGQLRDMYRRHIQVEAACVFRVAGECLDAATMKAMGEEMAERRGIRLGS